MGWSNQNLIDAAFEELALAGYEFDITPDEEQSALNKLGGMMGTWAGMGVQLPYAFGSALSADSGLPLIANEAAYLNLAVRIAASKGKALAATTRGTAKMAYDSLLVWISHQQLQSTQIRSGTPAGQGNRSIQGIGNGPFLPPPDTDVLQNGDTGLVFTGN